MPVTSVNSLLKFHPLSPDAVAVQCNEHQITYRNFESHIVQVASWLQSQGVCPNDTVGLFSRNPYWMWLLHLAAIALRCRHLTILPKYAQSMAEQVGMNVLVGDVFDESFRTITSLKIPFGKEAVAQLDTVSIHGLTPDSFNQKIESTKHSAGPERFAFTTGTTGTPKAVLWTSDILFSRVGQVGGSQHLNGSTTLHCTLGLETTAGFRYPLATWREGGTVLLSTDRANRLKLAQGSTLVVTAPSYLPDLLNHGSDVWPGKANRHMVVLGGRLAATHLEKFYTRIGSSAAIAYGSTEAGSVITGDARVLQRHPGAVGFPRENCEVEIVDDQDRPLPPEVRGRVRVRSPSMVQRYVSSENLDASQKAFRQGWFYPGDSGARSHDGLIVIDGRDSDIVNVKGVKVSVVDIEQRISEVPNISDCCVLVLQTPMGDELHVMVVTQVRDAQWLKETIRGQVNLRVPVRIDIVKTIPRNSMGKVPRLKLAKKLEHIRKEGVS